MGDYETEQECRERIERRTFNIQFDTEKPKGKYPVLDLLNVVFGIDLRSR